MGLNELAPWIAISITLSLSILVPLFTQIANNCHQRKMLKEKIKMEEKRNKIEAYKNFLLKVGATITFAKKDNLDIAGAYLYQMYLYCPSKWYDDLDKLSVLIREYKWDEAIKITQKLSKLVALELKDIE
ncbi:hypothetical protein [uncultured Thomasclavelia sp.]|uniref:hypothetical protein n=1 Tax=uncultured Thomasclavelia sp. TaxID=3025759 RepID=UPI00280B48B9|nr:hypothetical protein [uncultured Thomasclavelia sp.]